MNSNAASTRRLAFSTDSLPSSQGRDKRRRPERIGPRCAERVPIAHAEPQMVAQRFSLDDFVRVVIPERQRIAALGPFVGNFADLRKVIHGNAFALRSAVPVKRSHLRALGRYTTDRGRETTPQRAPLQPGNVPDETRAVGHARDQALAVGGEDHRLDAIGERPSELFEQAASAQVPEADRMLLGATAFGVNR